MKIASFVFNPFEENTYLLYDETGECVIIDPGCYDQSEQNELYDFIRQENLTPVRLLNTHCHIDHVLGNAFIAESFGLKPEIHSAERELLRSAADYGKMYGIMMQPSPDPLETLKENEIIQFGKTKLKVLFTPGHSPGSVCFYEEENNNLIGGDVLFRRSIGRTDLPGGDHQTLLDSLTGKLYLLPVNCVVHPGHGPTTTIGEEINHNPFTS